MTVEELIGRLKKMDGKSEVAICIDDLGDRCDLVQVVSVSDGSVSVTLLCETALFSEGAHHGR